LVVPGIGPRENAHSATPFGCGSGPGNGITLAEKLVASIDYNTYVESMIATRAFGQRGRWTV